jgi:hypothetical protein
LLQLTSFDAEVTTTWGGLLNVIVVELKHPFASVAVTVHVPAQSPVMFCVERFPGCHKYVYGLAPPEAFALASASHAP